MAATARDLMTSPVHGVPPETTISEAHAQLSRSRHGAMPIVVAERPVGLALANDIERADRHGLGDRPVGEIAIDAPVVTPEAPLDAVIAGLAPPGIGRVLVVEDERLVGYIARSDLVDYLYGASSPGSAEGIPARHGRRQLDAAALLMDRWEAGNLALLREIGQAAGDRPLFLVGGAVRDLLLERPSYDLDLMALGDGIAVAYRLQKHVGGKLTIHEPFGTATLELPDGRRLDVATARSERYESPGALPDTRPGALLADLERRDFTINAMAMRVDPASWARIVDPFGGMADLAAGSLRTLHNLSVLEDPARLVRGVRFERQLGFRLERTTEHFARYLLSTGRLDGIGGERIRLELKKLLALAGPEASVGRLADLDGLRLISSELARSGPAVSGAGALAALCRVDDVLALANTAWRPAGEQQDSCRANGQALVADAGVVRFRVALAVLLSRIGAGARQAAAEALHLAGREARAVLVAAERGGALARRLEDLGDVRPSQRYEALRPELLETLVMATAIAPEARTELVLEHLRSRHLRLTGLDGHWLQAQGLPPGPELGHILTQTLAAVLDGQVLGPEAERAFALQRVRERTQADPPAR